MDVANRGSVGSAQMYDSGYDPHEMANFFQLLESKNSEGRVAKFLSDHPTPGNRVAAVDQEVTLMPAKPYMADPPDFARAKATVARPPAPPPPPPTPAPAQTAPAPKQ